MESDTVALIEVGKIDEAVRALLARWRKRPQPEIAEALDLASAKLARPPIRGDSAGERHAEWLAIAAKGDAADVPRLLRGMLDGTAAAQVQARIEVLVEMGPDPRVAAALVEIVKGQVLFVSKHAFWRTLLDALPKMQDVRQIEPLRASIPRVYIDHPVGPGYVYGDLQGRLGVKLPQIIAKLEALDVPPISTADLQRVEAIRKTAAKRVSSEEQLLDAILDDPTDDSARMVYADALIARDDGRGELIAAQLRRARGEKFPAKVEQKLLAMHRAAVLGPLAPITYQPVIERGFLARCHVVVQSAQHELLAHRWWRTVEDLATVELDLITRDDLSVLRRVHVTHPDVALQLLRGDRTAPNVRALVLPWSFEFQRDVADSAAFPALTVLEVHRNGREVRTVALDLRDILGGRLGRNVREVVVHSNMYGCPLELDTWREVEQVERVRFDMRFMRGTFSAGRLEVELIGGGAMTELRRHLEAVVNKPEVVIVKAPRGTKPGGLRL